LYRPQLAAVGAITFILFFLPVSGYIGFFFAQLDNTAGISTVFQRQYLQSLTTSLILALCTACCAGILGSLQALILQRMVVPWRRFFLLTYVIPFLIPPYIHAITWIRLLDGNGLLVRFFSMSDSRQLLYGLLYSKVGVVFILSIAGIPLVTTIVMAGLLSVDGRQEETALCNGSPFMVLRKISLPLVRPHMLAGCLLVVLFTLNSFDVPDILRVRVAAVEIFIQLAAMSDEMGALIMSLPLVIIALLLTIIIQKSMRCKKYVSFAGRIRKNNILLTEKKYTRAGFVLLVIIWLVSTALPCTVLVSAIPGVDVFWTTLSSSYDELLYSTLLALCCAATALLCSIPYAYLLARRYPIGPVIDFFSLFPLAVPAALFSLGLIQAGNFFNLHCLSATSLFCLTGLVAHFLFLSIKILQAGIEQIDFQGEEAALLTGASTFRILVKIILLRLKTSAAVAFFLLFICCFSELSATLLLVPPGRETVAVKIYNLMHYGADDMVASLCLLIILVMVLFGAFFRICYLWITNGHRSKPVEL
jgi:iron(III) transport system permease protein